MSYHDEQKRQQILKVRQLQKELPKFVGEFFRDRADYISDHTRLAYAYDLKLFFGFLVFESVDFAAEDITGFTVDDLKRVNAGHILEFMEYLSYYIRRETGKGGKVVEYHVQNDARGKGRKLSAIRALLSYCFSKDYIPSNPSELVATPPTKEKAKTYLDVHEVANLLDIVESGEKLTPQQQHYHAYTKSRDLALLTLFAGTGVRISEAVGLNINDINLEDESFRVIRKGGDEAILFFGLEVKAALMDYIAHRKGIIPKQGHEAALFLSMQRRRITTRAVQILVKKYAEQLNTLKTITPHKLRTTFGTNMYRQTGDIYLVADLLGHKDVNTTRKSYADDKDEAGRRAVRHYKLREDD